MEYKIKNRISCSIVVLFISLLTIYLTIHLYVKKESSDIFKKFVDGLISKEKGVYKVEHNHFDIDLVGKQIILKNLKILIDGKKLGETGYNRKTLFEIEIPFLSITGISFFNLIFNREITFGKLYIRHGKFRIYSLNNKAGNKIDPVKTGPRQAVSIDKIILDNSNISFFNSLTGPPLGELNNLDLEAENINIIHGRSIQSNLFENKFRINLKAKKSFIKFISTNYRAETDLIKFSSATSSASLTNFRYLPGNKEDRKKKIVERGGFHQFNIKKIYLRNLDIPLFLEKNRVFAGQLFISNPHVYIFRDKNVLKKVKREGKKLPQQLFREAKLKIGFNMIRIINGMVKYSELARGELKEEHLTFTGLNLSFKDISNFPEIMKSGKETNISVSVLLPGKSMLKGKIVVPVNSERDQFSFSGSLQRTNLKLYNKYLKRNARIRIDGGILRNMRFYVKADRDRATGKMKLSYSDLRVTLLRRKNLAKRRKFRTFLANTFIHRNNPGKGSKRMRTGDIYFIRESKRSIFNYMWKCILSGIKSSIKH